ncbi:hypothetical protein G6F64_009943 [Rhizopus arrhizus]|uniref:Galactose oxidase n=1 Tax=Rhizopus oryzae TaxID=64495 RepID=A0A9P6X257_RHIOR|nr:hypothetical protein G6F64_009943 [Rhizopus arrhizus]
MGDNGLYSLDINQYYGKESNALNSKWNVITSSNSFDVETRRTPEFAVLADGKSFLLVGGLNIGSTGSNGIFANQTILYNAVQNTWEKLPDYSEPNRAERQIFFGSATNLPSDTHDTIGFYGGFEDRPNMSIPMISESGLTVNSSGDGSSVRGFDSLTVFNITSKTWSIRSPQTNIPTNFFVNSHTATLNPRTGKMYILGGSYYTATSVIYPIRFSFSETYVFDTVIGSWSLVKLNAASNSRIPSDRVYHSATMMPNSQDILVYGGTNDGRIAVTDYCYTLNLDTNTWTEQVNVSVPTSVTANGARFAHTAVLVNTTLFILFGKDINGSPSPNSLTFDISNIANIQYTTTYPFISPDSSSGNSSGSSGIIPNMGSPQSNGLSGGAKAGIAIGVVAGVAAIAAGAFFFYRHKKNEDRAPQGDVMHVDWDKIESQYREVQAPPVYSSHGRDSIEMSRQTPDAYEPITFAKPSAN